MGKRKKHRNRYYDNCRYFDYDCFDEDDYYDDCGWQQYGPGCGCMGPTRIGNCCGPNRGNGCGCGCSNLGCGRGCYQTAGGALGTSCFFTNPILIWLLLLSRPRFWGC